MIHLCKYDMFWNLFYHVKRFKCHLPSWPPLFRLVHPDVISLGFVMRTVHVPRPHTQVRLLPLLQTSNLALGNQNKPFFPPLSERQQSVCP